MQKKWKKCFFVLDGVKKIRHKTPPQAVEQNAWNAEEVLLH